MEAGRGGRRPHGSGEERGVPQWKRLEAGRSWRRSTVGGEEVEDVAASCRRPGGAAALGYSSCAGQSLDSPYCTPAAALLHLLM